MSFDLKYTNSIYISNKCLGWNMKASFDQEKTRIEIPASKADQDVASSTIMDTICGSGENRIMFRFQNLSFIIHIN